MKQAAKTLFFVLLALILTLSVAVLPAVTVYADRAFTHPLSDAATDADKYAVEELEALDAAHIYSFDVSDFHLPYNELFGDVFIDDAEAYNGVAAMMTAESRQNEKANQLYLPGADSPIHIKLVEPDNTVQDVTSSITRANLVVDGNYHLYKVENVIAHKGASYKFLFIFMDWGFQVSTWGEKLAHLADQKVNLYLSMKIEGDMDFKDSANLPVYYIDRIIVTDSCYSYDIEYTGTIEATCTTNAARTGICPVCGQTAIRYEMGTVLEHTFTNYITKEDGSQSASCDYGCGTIDTIEAPTEAPSQETDPAEEPAAPLESAPAEDQDDRTTGNSGELSPAVLIILGIVFAVLVIAAAVAVVKGNRKLSWILSAVSAALLIAGLILYLTGAQPSNDDPSTSEITGEAFADATEETTGALDNTEPTIPELTEDNSLDLGKMQVVLPWESTEIEANAAKELVEYIQKMTGQTIPVVKEGSVASVEAGIYIGDTEFAMRKNITHPSSEYGEGWAIKAIDGNLVLCGDPVRGPLYAVYHLLEDALGIHWFTYTEEYIPEAEAALVWNAYEDSGAPAFNYRDMHPGALCTADNMFQVRNRLNGWATNPPQGFGGEENFGSPVYVHSFATYLPDDLYDTHPEWFSLVNGERVTGGQMCMTNPELAEYVTNKMLNYIAYDIELSNRYGTARPRWYALVPNDYNMFCECEDCVAAIEKSGMSGYLLQFINKIADVIAVEYPEVIVDTLAYSMYVEPPLDDTKPAKNVQIRFANPWMDIYHSIAHENNADMLAWAKAWAELVDNPNQFFLWDYLVTYKDAGPATFMYKFPEHFQTLKEIGFTGYFGEQENPINSDFWDMKLWLAAKMLEDPYQDFDALVDTFLNDYYGAAGPYVREYLDMAEEMIANDPNPTTFGTPANKPRWLKAEIVVAADEAFNKAFDAANGDPDLLRRLRLARLSLDRSILERFDFFVHTAEEMGLECTLDKLEVCQRVVDTIHEQLAYRGNVDYTVTGGVNDYGWVVKYETMLNRLSGK